MSLVLYNTLHGRKEEFAPLNDGRVGMYVCGPTVYDHSHIGHARAVVVFDVLFRYLKDLGYQVDYIRNFTDLDDKIIDRANEEDVDFRELAERHIRSFHEDMDALGAQRPTREPRATEYINEMVADIEELVGRGAAYQAGGDVYFDVAALQDYGRLSGRNREDMQAGARIKVDERKKSPWDFALWKESKPGEPSWESPWSRGRPGWHIECSAMSDRLLGAEFDIHGGGHDLVFPHHENELAQAEGLGRGFARIWLHNGFVRVNNEKMSKSLGNFFTIKEVLNRFDPEVVRLFLISKHYRSPIDFSDEALAETGRSLDRAYRALQLVEKHGFNLDARNMGPASQDFRDAFTAAMNDDLNTARAIGAVFEAVREINSQLGEKTGAASPETVEDLAGAVLYMGGVLGLFGRSPAEYERSRTDSGLEETGLSAEEVEEQIRRRAAARSRKDFAEADRIRDQLREQGIILEDKGGETSWRVEG